MDNMPVLTVPLIEGMKVVEYKGFVSARNVRAINIVRDMFTSVRDVFGGRSGSYQDVMSEMEAEVMREIRFTALSMGANAIVGFTIDFDNIGSKNTSLLMAFGKGTAVVVE
ncbi:MAG: YbjQ family protein [Lentisphaerae bacterium]|jgi:uncharacterized protein YbjQ (UPF0145 family)|nr:YbjQ family protein [Lentisphaerota bacterium]